MFFRKFTCSLLFCIGIFATFSYAESPLRLAAGLSAGSPTPFMATIGAGYKAAIFYVEGLGVHSGTNDFWTGLRGSLDWTFFREKPYSIDLGVSGGYEYSRAPNEMHKALNDANDARIVYPYNYKEILDISIDLRIHVLGVYSQIDYPVYRFKDHDADNFTWRIGYMFEL